MKKKIYTLLFLAVGVLAVVSCQDDKPKGPVENGYYFALTSHDEHGNVSELSNEAYAENVETVAGAAVSSGTRVFAPNRRGFMTVPSPTYANNKAMFQNTNGANQGIVNIKFKSSMRANIAKAALGGVANGAMRSAAKTGLENVDRAAASIGGNVTFERIFEYIEKHEARAQRHGLDLWYSVRFDKSAPLSRAIAAFDNIGEIEKVETVHPTVINDGSQNAKTVLLQKDGLMDHATRAADLPFNDPLLSRQWHYDRNVQDQFIADGGHINLLRAWQKTAGSNKVIVAIIDQGLDITHEDLKDALWINKGEIPGNGIDDDGNGFIDDINGWNFCTRDGDLSAPDDADHGCHVGGTIGATNNNGKGVCGIAGGTGKGDGVRLMSCDVHSVQGPGDTREAQAFRYAADNGAIIAQCSWGFSNAGMASDVQKEAIDYFIENAGNAEHFPDSPMRGGIAIFASGNTSATSGKYYPAAYDNVISVTATNNRGNRPKYANVAEWVNIAAPGGDEATNYFVNSCLRNNKYGGKQGTSMATPHVSGVAALLVSANPGITPDKLREMLLTSGKNIDDTAPEFIGKMGVGCINASKYLSVDKKDAPGKVTNLDFKFQKSYKLEWTVPADPSYDDIAGYTMYYDVKPIKPETMATAKQMKVDTVMSPGTIFTLDVEKIPGIKIKK